MTNAEIASRLAETASIIHDLAIDHASTKGAFESHRRHCDTEKAEIKAELKSINGKMWAGLVLLIFQLIGLLGYVAVNGPVISQAHAESK